MTFDLTPSKSGYLIINSNLNLTVKCRVEFEFISDSFRMLELSNAQHVNVCHYLKVFLIGFEVIDISKAYRNLYQIGSVSTADYVTLGARLHMGKGPVFSLSLRVLPLYRFARMSGSGDSMLVS